MRHGLSDRIDIPLFARQISTGTARAAANSHLAWKRCGSSRTAEQGNAAGQYYLAVMYENGWGVRRDREAAVRWHRRAADQGHSGARASNFSFAAASNLFWELAAVRVETKQVERAAEALGRAVGAAERAMAETVPSPAPTMYLGVPGAGRHRCAGAPHGGRRPRWQAAGRFGQDPRGQQATGSIGEAIRRGARHATGKWRRAAHAAGPSSGGKGISAPGDLHVKSVTSGDIDGDGDSDLWVDSVGGKNIDSHFIVHNGDGTFTVDEDRAPPRLRHNDNYPPDYWYHIEGQLVDLDSDWARRWNRESRSTINCA